MLIAALILFAPIQGRPTQAEPAVAARPLLPPYRQLTTTATQFWDVPGHAMNTQINPTDVYLARAVPGDAARSFGPTSVIGTPPSRQPTPTPTASSLHRPTMRPMTHQLQCSQLHPHHHSQLELLITPPRTQKAISICPQTMGCLVTLHGPLGRPASSAPHRMNNSTTSCQ